MALLLSGCTELTIGSGAHTGEIDIEDSVISFGGFKVAPSVAVAQQAPQQSGSRRND